LLDSVPKNAKGQDDSHYWEISEELKLSAAEAEHYFFQGKR
jgi:hypothetical protein